MADADSFSRRSHQQNGKEQQQLVDGDKDIGGDSQGIQDDDDRIDDV